MKRMMLAAVLVAAFGMSATPREASAGPIRGGFRLLGRAFATRLYYNNAFRSYIPGTGYGGFARPAFGWRGD